MVISADVSKFKLDSFLACEKSCRECFGPSNGECLDCYPPYYLDPETPHTCIFNETLAAIISNKYTPVINISF